MPHKKEQQPVSCSLLFPFQDADSSSEIKTNEHLAAFSPNKPEKYLDCYYLLNASLGALYGYSILNMLPISVHLTFANEFKATINLKQWRAVA
jgi:hypothetical protein